MYGHLRSQSAGQPLRPYGPPATFPPATPPAGQPAPVPVPVPVQQPQPLLYTPGADVAAAAAASAQQAAYYSYAAAPGAAGGEWNQQMQAAQYQQQMMGGAAPGYDWSSAYAYPLKEADAGGGGGDQQTAAAAAAHAQQQQQQYGEYYAYVNQEAYKAQAVAMQQQHQQQQQAAAGSQQSAYFDAYGQMAAGVQAAADMQAYQQQQQQQAQAYGVAGAGMTQQVSPPGYYPQVSGGMAMYEYTSPPIPLQVAGVPYSVSAPVTPLASAGSAGAGAGWVAGGSNLSSPARASQLHKGFGSTGHGAENLVRVEIVDPRNAQRLEQLTALVTNPPKPPVSPLRPTERTLFQAQLDEEKVRTDNLIAPEPPMPPPPELVGEAVQAPAGSQETGQVAPQQTEQDAEEAEEDDIAAELGTVHITPPAEEVEPGASSSAAQTAGAGGAGGSVVHCGAGGRPMQLARLRTTPTSPMMRSPQSAGRAVSPKSPLVRVRQEESIGNVTLPPRAAAAVATLLHSPHPSPSTHSSVELRRARLMELARSAPSQPQPQPQPDERTETDGEDERNEVQQQQQPQQPQLTQDDSAAQEQQQEQSAVVSEDAGSSGAHAQSEDPAGSISQLGDDSSRVSGDPSESSAAPSGGAPQPSEAAAFPAPTAAAATFERVSPQDVRVQPAGGGSFHRHPRQRRFSEDTQVLRGGGAWANQAVAPQPTYQPHYLATFPQAPPLTPLYPLLAMSASATLLDPATMSMQPASVSFPIISNAPLSYAGGGGGGGGGAGSSAGSAQRHHKRRGGHHSHHSQQQQQQGQGQQPLLGVSGGGGGGAVGDVRQLTGILPLEGGFPSPLQRVAHPAPGQSSGPMPLRSLDSPAGSSGGNGSGSGSGSGGAVHSPSLSAVQHSASGSAPHSPRPLWLAQQSRVHHLPVFSPELEEPRTDAGAGADAGADIDVQLTEAQLAEADQAAVVSDIDVDGHDRPHAGDSDAMISAHSAPSSASGDEQKARPVSGCVLPPDRDDQPDQSTILLD